MDSTLVWLLLWGAAGFALVYVVARVVNPRMQRAYERHPLSRGPASVGLIAIVVGLAAPLVALFSVDGSWLLLWVLSAVLLATAWWLWKRGDPGTSTA